MTKDIPALLIVETTSYGQGDRVNKRGLAPLGHYFEGIEAFSSNWPGHVVLLSPPQTPRTLSGVDEYIDTHNDAQPNLFLAYKKSSKRQALLNFIMKSPMNFFGKKLLRFEYESFSASSVGAMTMKTIERFPNSIVLIPTANERVVEGIIQQLAHVFPPQGSTPIFIPVWHYNDRWNPLLVKHFSEQLTRWMDRAKPWRFYHAAALEINAKELSAPTRTVRWLPWPLSTSAPATATPATPRIYIYSVRKEHGRNNLKELCESILDAKDSVQIRLWVSRGSQRSLGNLTSHPKVEVLLQGGEIARYNSNFEGVTVGILPYEVEPYRNRGSAVLLSFMANRIPVIVPYGTGLGTFVEKEQVGLTYKNHRDIASLSSDIMVNYAQYSKAINTYLEKHRRAASALHESTKEGRGRTE